MYSQDYDGYVVPCFLYGATQGDQTTLDWWDDLLQPYVKNRRLVVCPSDATPFIMRAGQIAPRNLWDKGNTQKPVSYQPNNQEGPAQYWPMNPSFTGRYGYRETTKPGGVVGMSVHESMVANPAETIWLVEYSRHREVNREERHDYYTDPLVQKPYERHQGGSIMCFGDGHVKWVKRGSTKPSWWTIQQD